MKRYTASGALLGLAAACTIAGAQPVAAPDATGVWLGTLRDGRKIELRLSQDTPEAVSGYAYFEGRDELGDCSVYGERNGDLALLELDSPNPGENGRLEFQLGGESAQGRLVTSDGGVTALEFHRQRPATGDSPALRLWNNDMTAFSSWRPSEEYNVKLLFMSRDRAVPPAVTFYHADLTVKLAGTLLTEAAGSWTLNSTDGGLQLTLSNGTKYREGRVAAWNVLGNQSRIYFKSPDTLSLLGHVNFDRFKNGTIGEQVRADPDSLAVKAEMYATIPGGQWIYDWPSERVPNRQRVRGLGYTITLVQR